MNRNPFVRRAAVLAVGATLAAGYLAAGPSVAGADSDDQTILCTLNSPTDCTVTDPDGIARVEVIVPVEFGDGSAHTIDSSYDCETEVVVHFDVINPNFTFVVTDCSTGGGQHGPAPERFSPSKRVVPTTQPTTGGGPTKVVAPTTSTTGVPVRTR